MFKRFAAHIRLLVKDIKLFSRFLSQYLHKKIAHLSRTFEKNKNMLVRFLLMKRGRYNRPFLHLTAMGVLILGVLVAPLLADTYPLLSGGNVLSTTIARASENESISLESDVFQTRESLKPRDEVITYKVQKGDTISTIAEKFSQPNNVISEDTIRWANDIKGNDITVGDELKILPVTGVTHKVASGDTVYTIAKKYSTESQKIVDFPFNEFANPETFSLVVGEILVIPDGVPPTEKPAAPRQVFIAKGSIPVVSGGFAFPVPGGGISQFASWYHMALDITSDMGTPVYAAQSGTVTRVSTGSWDGGYGTNLWVSNGQGIETHYAHLSEIRVSVGQTVTAGSTVIALSGNSGRSTGPHTHFEIRRNGTLVDPLPYVQ